MIKIKDLNKVNDKRSKSRRRKKNPPTKEEKTIRITKQTDFVQRDEFHGAEEPMPNVTFREIKRQKKAAQKAAEREQEEQLRKEAEEAEKVGVGAYISLFFAVCFFSGVFYKMPDAYRWLGAFDFTTLIGKFGSVSGAATFVGKGGLSARAGFLFALSLVPGVMLALGLLEVLSHYGALKAAQKLMTPLLRPILGAPGITGLALITDLQSTDAGAALTKGLVDSGKITKENLIVIAGWQYAGAGLINNYFSIASALFMAFLVPVWIPLVVMFCLKFVGGVFVRFCLKTLYKKDFENA